MAAPGWSPGRRGVLALALAAVAAAVVLVVVVARAQQDPPQPRPAGRIDGASHSPTQTQAQTQQPGPGRHPRAEKSPPPLGPSRPTVISIPSIGVQSPVNPIGLAADGSLQVPQPGPHLDEAAWFENSPTPGQPGPSIIEGHVDSTEGPSVFFELGDVHPGDRIIVHRADGRALTFRVDAVRDFLKTEFPTRLVYGGRDLSRPTLRVITCSDFDASTHHHVGNEVVFAHLERVAGSS